MRPRPNRQRVSGFSLIEIMIVVVILAVVATGTTLAFGAVGRTRLRSSCMRLVAAARFAYNRAIVQGTTVRIRLNADNHQLSIEEAQGRVLLAREDDERRREMDEEDEDRAAVDPWAAAQARLQRTLEPSFGASPFSVIRGRGGEVLEAYKPKRLGDNIRVVRMFVPHEREPRTQGVGSIYFFPGGRTEHAVVQLSDSSDRIYSVEIHPLTGRGKVHAEEYEPKDYGDEEFSEVEDPG